MNQIQTLLSFINNVLRHFPSNVPMQLTIFQKEQKLVISNKINAFSESSKNQNFSCSAMFSFLKVVKLSTSKDQKWTTAKDFGLCYDLLSFSFLLPFAWSKLGETYRLFVNKIYSFKLNKSIRNKKFYPSRQFYVQSY